MDSLEEKVEVELTVAEERAQFEKEKLSRRQALARIGFQAGAAAIAALTADELLRKVGKEMQRRTKDHKVAQQVAKELSNAGVANALAIDVPTGSKCKCNVTGSGTSWWFCTVCTTNEIEEPEENITPDVVPGKWPALNCDKTINDCEGCCRNQYDTCVDRYKAQGYSDADARSFCNGKLDDCLDRICK